MPIMTMTPEKFHGLCKRIVDRSDELEFNSQLWFEGRNASLITYNTGLPQEKAIRQVTWALLNYQLLILYTLWETKSNNGDKASVPIAFGEATEKSIAELASSIALQNSPLHSAPPSEIARKKVQIQRICNNVQNTQRRFGHTLQTVKLARNKIIAHNLTSAAIASLNVFELRWFSLRTARICRMIAKIHDRHPRITGTPRGRLQKNSIIEFWSLLEGDRAGAVSED
jgi:hypothetical protein